MSDRSAALVRSMTSYRVLTRGPAKVPYTTRRGEQARLYKLEPSMRTTHWRKGGGSARTGDFVEYVVVSMCDPKHSSKCIVFVADADGTVIKPEHIAFEKIGDFHKLLRKLGYEPDLMVEAVVLEREREAEFGSGK